MKKAVVIVTLALILGACGSGAQDADYVATIDAWHAQREAALAAEDGWLSLVALLPIERGARTLGSAPDAELRLPAPAPPRVGTITLNDAGGLGLEPAPGVPLRVGDDVLNGPISLVPDSDGEPTEVSLGTLRFYAIERGGAFFLRVKDREAPARLHFTGVDRFPVDTRWRVEARLEADSARSIAIPNVLGQLDDAPCPGRLVFTLDGAPCSLWPIAEAGEELFLVFADASTGDSTYGGGRFLSAPAPDADGHVTLDFNRAVNPPCAFSPYATCPLPPEGNTLSVAVLAGEKNWGSGH